MAKGKKSTQKAGSTIPHSHANWIADLKNKIRSSQLKAALSVTREMLLLYWDIGQDLANKQNKHGWNTEALEKMAKDLQNKLPGVEGFSSRNLLRMKAFYLAYAKAAQSVQQLDELPVFSLPWGHNIILLQQIENETVRLWYANMAIAEGWSREALVDAIQSGMHKH